MKYIADFVGKQLGFATVAVTDSVEELKRFRGPKINYSSYRIGDETAWIKPHGLLAEQGIRPQPIRCFLHNGKKAFFETEGDYPFDVFAASFYLLSRYEEYLPHKEDSYGRYDYRESLAWKEQFLQQPLVDQWILDLRRFLVSSMPVSNLKSREFSFIPTYDIDMAWAYQHKGRWRNVGGFMRSFLRGKWSECRERIQVVRKKDKDPYDAYEWLNGLHKDKDLRPVYFFLVPLRRGRYDKNISPHHEAMQKLIRDHAAHYPVGVHPSWHSGENPALVKTEIETLSGIAGTLIRSSRQHYIRFSLPHTFRQLIENGIHDDYSMGYGSINGFRASIASSFYWYDLQKEETTGLLLHPFCFMDANSFYEQGYSASQALQEMQIYRQAVRDVNGELIMIWHNSFLGGRGVFREWRNVYEQFVRETVA